MGRRGGNDDLGVYARKCKIVVVKSLKQRLRPQRPRYDLRAVEAEASNARVQHPPRLSRSG